MFKNTAGQIWVVFAFDRTDNSPKTGDALNITANLRIDGGAANAVDDTNPTELEDGYYYFNITQAESNGDSILISPQSSTADIQVIGCPAAVYTDVVTARVPDTISLANINGEVGSAIETYGLDHLVAVADADNVVDDSIIAKLAAADGDWSNFAKNRDSLQAIVERGNLAWVTGAGAGAENTYTSTAWTRTTGDNDGGAGTDTAEVDGTYFATGETGAGTYLEVDVTFTLGTDEIPDSLDFWGFYDGGSGHSMQVQAQDSDTLSYEPIGAIGQGTIVVFESFQLRPNHVNASDEVKIKFIHTGGVGNASHVFNVDKAQVSARGPAITITEDSIADQVWNEQISGHTTAGTFGAKNQKVVPSETIADYKATGFSTHSAADVWAVATRALTDKAGFTISGTKTTLDDLNDLSEAQVNAQVDSALDTPMPATPTSGSVNDYLKRAKFALCNKWTIDETTGDLEIFNDSGASFTTVAAAFTTLANVTTRKKIL